MNPNRPMLHELRMIFGLNDRSHWRKLLEGCDYNLAAQALWHQLGQMPIDEPLAAVAEAFLAHPRFETAIALIQVHPDLALLFRECQPGGAFRRLCHHHHN